VILQALLLSTVFAQETTAAFEHIDASREAHVAFLRELIRAGEHGEETVQAIVRQRFESLGCDVDVVRAVPSTLRLEKEFAATVMIDEVERVSVVGVCKGTGGGGGRSLLFFGHPDSIRVDPAGWTKPLFDGVVEDRRLYGWGIADDLAGVALMAEAMAAIRAAEVPLRGDVILASTASKRNGRGILAVLRAGYRADAAVYLHPAESGGGLGEIKSLTSGLLRFQVTVTGEAPDTTEPGHTAFAHRSVPATRTAMRVMEALEGLDAERGERVQHPLLDAQVGRSTNLLVADLACGNAAGLSRVPTECVIGATLTFPPGEAMEAVQREVEDAVREYEDVAAVEWLYGTPGVETSVDDPLYRTVSDAIESVTGTAPIPYALHSGSDIRNPVNISGTPSVGFGPLAGGLTHSSLTDEWIDLDDYTLAMKAVVKIVIDWVGATP
jgi:acetylornithine deacetylase